MLALVANATQETDAAIVAALAGFWLWRHGKLGRTVRRTGRVAAALVAVVVAVRVSPALCVIACGCVIGGWLWKHRHARERRRFQKVWNRGWRLGQRSAALGVSPDRAKFMASAAWQRQRKAALKRAGYRCEVRGCRGGMLEVHHNNNDVYGRLAAARPSDLNVLCAAHHRVTTDLHRYRGYTIAQATRMVMTAGAYASA